MGSLFLFFSDEAFHDLKSHLSNHQTRVTFTLVPSTLRAGQNSRKRADSE